MRLNELHSDPANRRKHPDRNLAMLVDALTTVGAARSIVIDEDDTVLAGNGVLAAAAQAGISKVEVVDADGDTVVAVRRRNLTPEQKRQLAMFDNRTAELAEWNLEQLQADAAAGLDLKPFFFDNELSDLLGGVPLKRGRTDPDAVPEPRPTSIQLGDLFELGSHRLLCGDSTQPAVIARVLLDDRPSLMVTDPPYGVEYDPAWRARAGVNRNTKKLGTVANDHRADWTEVWRLFPGSVAYVWHAGLKAAEVQASLEAANFVPRAQIVWAKDRFALSRGDYHWQHEPCWYAVRKDATSGRTEDRTQSTLWMIPAREDAGHGHGTQKPVECMLRPMRNHTSADVFEPFCGSGTSIIAAESLRRRCLALELEPSYCQVTIDRWEAFTGERATKVGELVRG